VPDCGGIAKENSIASIALCNHLDQAFETAKLPVLQSIKNPSDLKREDESVASKGSTGSEWDE